MKIESLSNSVIYYLIHVKIASKLRSEISKPKITNIKSFYLHGKYHVLLLEKSSVFCAQFELSERKRSRKKWTPSNVTLLDETTFDCNRHRCVAAEAADSSLPI